MRMENHQRGPDWMWFGPVTANANAYRLGATTFDGNSRPIPPQSVSGTELLPLMAGLRAVATQAVNLEDDEAPATNYGELLATSAACHADG
ncbi:MAG: hypothetical protein ACJAZO_000452 [Myxococcota bacterium]|jgi:hypothetical protein